MIFKLGTIEVTLDCRAQFPYQQGTELIQAKERTSTGILHTENFHVKIAVFSYVFVDMSDADYQKVMDWYLNKAEGMATRFELTDDLGVKRYVRFVEPRISFEQTDYGLWSGGFTVEEC